MSEPVTRFKVPVRLSYTIRAGYTGSRALRGLKDGKIYGYKCPATGKIYPDPRGPSPTDGELLTDQVELPDTGIVTQFCIVNIPSGVSYLSVPYAAGSILIDGADSPIFHLIGGCEYSQVRMGMRVRAKWKPREEWTHSTVNILYFEPTGEPDAAPEAFKGNR